MPDVAIDSDSATINSVNLTEQGSDPATPATSHWRLYAKAGGLYLIDDTGAVVGPLGEAVGDMVNPMTTLYDMIVGGADGAPTRLAVGVGGDYLTVGASGPEWMTPAFPSVIYNSAWASPPGAPSTGELWAPSDGYALYIREGAAWVPICPIRRLTPPPLVATWTWGNQGTATATDDRSHILMTSPVEASWTWRLLRTTLPGASYTVTACIETGGLAVGATNSGVCIGWRQAAAGATQNYMHVLTAYCSANGPTWNLASQKHNGYTGGPAVYTSGYLLNHDPAHLWLRIADTGANRVCSYSANGIDWHQLHSVANTDYLTQDELVWGVIGGGIARLARLTSWKVV